MKKVFISFLLLASLVVWSDELAEAARRAPRAKLDNPTLRLAGEKAERYGVPEKLLKAIVCQESSCGANPIARRERSKSWEKRARKVTKSKKEFEALMHSYGATQLSGLYTYLETGIHPHELLDDEVNLEVAAARLAREVKACRGSEYCAAARWNGGPRPNKQAREYAKSVMKWKERV